MQKNNLLTYADSIYRPQQAKLVEYAQSLHCFDTIYTKNRCDLVETEFYKTHKYIFDKEKGGGMCLWKPYFIINTLSRMEQNDVLLYMDAADWITNSENIREEILSYMSDKDMCLTAGAFPNKMYTKRDCFVQMGCDSDKYWNAIQLEAGIILIKNTEYTKKIMLEWLNWCKIPSIITDDENVCGFPNLEDFKEIRYDQSVLTNLKVKYDLFSSDFLRKFITCNVNMPK